MTRPASLLMHNLAWWTLPEPHKLFCHLWVAKGSFGGSALLGSFSMFRHLTENSTSLASVHLPAFLPECLNLMIGNTKTRKPLGLGYLWNKKCQKFSLQLVIKYILVEVLYVPLSSFNLVSIRLSSMNSSPVSCNLTTSISWGSVDHPEGPVMCSRPFQTCNSLLWRLTGVYTRVLVRSTH